MPQNLPICILDCFKNRWCGFCSAYKNGFWCCCCLKPMSSNNLINDILHRFRATIHFILALFKSSCSESNWWLTSDHSISYIALLFSATTLKQVIFISILYSKCVLKTVYLYLFIYFSSFLRMNIIVIVLVLLSYVPHRIDGIVTSETAEETVTVKKFCAYDRVWKMVSYDCSDMDLREVPQHLKTSVEVNWIYCNCIAM